MGAVDEKAFLKELDFRDRAQRMRGHLIINGDKGKRCRWREQHAMNITWAKHG